MRVIDATFRRRHFREFDYFFGFRVTAGRVVKPGRDAERPIVHRLRHQPFHFFELRRSRLHIVGTKHAPANRSVSSQQNCIRADALRIPLAQGLANIGRTAAIIAGDDGRHALCQISEIALTI